jgi:hypothetical protein
MNDPMRKLRELVLRIGGLFNKQEMSIRAALGASRQRLTRQMLTECLVLAFAGGGARLLLAYWLTRLLASFNLADALGPLARVTKIMVDPRVLGFALLLSIGTALLFGLLPALRLSDTNVPVPFLGRQNPATDILSGTAWGELRTHHPVKKQLMTQTLLWHTGCKSVSKNK